MQCQIRDFYSSVNTTNINVRGNSRWMGQLWRTLREMHENFGGGKPEEREHLEDVGLDGKNKSKRILTTKDEWVWSGLI